MTVSSTVSRWTEVGNGVDTVFTKSARVFETTDIKVYLDAVLQASGFTTTIAATGDSFTVTFSSPPASGVTILLVRDVPLTQSVQYPYGGAFPAPTADRVADRATVQVQQLNDKINRSVRLAETDISGLDPTLPALAAGNLLQVNSAGTALQAAAAADLDLATVTAFAATLLDDADAATARATLGVAADPITTRGDIIVGDSSGDADRLGIGSSGQIMKSDGADPSWGWPSEAIVIACSDETTALTTGTAKVTFRMPFAMTVSAVRASLSTAQTSGSIVTVDINDGGATILSTKLTIDNGEKTSATAAAAAVISDAALADDAEVTIDIDQIGDGTAKGLKVTLIGTRA